MKKNESISGIMSTELTTVHDGQPVSQLRQIFEEKPIHHVPVVSGEKLIGIVTSNDFMRVSFGEFGNQDGKGLDSILDHTYKMHDIMNQNPVTIPQTATIRDAARLLGSHSFHALPVVDGEKLVGLVTSTDLINFLAEL
ncbi:CBS domain-containing protein [Mariniblastus fucicola]|uniref:Inosine 5'-monophosphate dehydrogenase n=1 Tax=Mariniblastus fucicola TaxID=980251 RepID=A0A5B9P6E0_9BACT|nr:CBS domain-containing protein [Mariniblastus fucicola]QEG20562.1 inosine 5'-monophosphate dehydrogenase [Mariniblastus fucicola]